MGNHPFFILNEFMKNFYFITLLVAGVLFFLNSCSSSSEDIQIKKQETDSLYVFDEIPKEDAIKFQSPIIFKPIDHYVVQVGAFSSEERAAEFAEFSRQKLNREIRVEYDEIKKLFLVQVYPPYKNKSEALLFRNDIGVYPEYRDAWVKKITSEKK